MVTGAAEDATVTAARITEARAPFDVFGEVAGDSTQARLDTLQHRYRQLAKQVHPDRYEGGEAAFKRLTTFYLRARAEVARGAYSEERPVRIGSLLLRRGPVFSGDSADYFEGTEEVADFENPSILLKLVRRPGDSRHLRREADVLARLLAEEGVQEHEVFFPAFVRMFPVRTGAERRTALLLRRPYPHLHDLWAVRRRYPTGVHPKDVAWMFRRLLFVLGLVHRHGRVHGAVLPEHVLIEPALHGLVLIDWKHSVRVGDRIRTIPPRTRDSYPPEVLAKEPAGPATDIRMAADCMSYLLGGRTRPEVLHTFLRGCRQDSPRRRPQDAWALRAEFDELIERLWGPRRFHPFTMD